MYVQYLNYMKNALMLDFGIPFQQPHTTVTALIGKTWGVTLQVGMMTVLFAFTFGILLGLFRCLQSELMDRQYRDLRLHVGIHRAQLRGLALVYSILAVRLELFAHGGMERFGPRPDR